MRLVQVSAGPRLDDIRKLFREYQRWLGVDLCFQSFEEELAALPGKYGPPRGRLLLALEEGRPAGCVALRPIAGGACEMKRLFVRDEFRGLGIGRRLAEAIVKAGREMGYRSMKLDTVPKLKEALGLYASMGFEPTEPYVFNPLEGAIFLEKKLAARRKTVSRPEQ